MNTLDLFSLVASIVSMVLAIAAIWLSIVFFRMTTAASTATTEAARGISASVERLEKLFDKLYSDTFSMMKDTVSDMRKHIWPADNAGSDGAIDEIEEKAQEKLKQFKKEMEQELSKVLQGQEQVSGLRHDLERLLEEAMSASRRVAIEAREETIRGHILGELRRVRRIGRSPTTAQELVEKLGDEFPATRVIDELESLRKEGLIRINSDDIGPRSIVRLSPIPRESTG